MMKFFTKKSRKDDNEEPENDPEETQALKENEQPAPETIVELKKGDYNIHILIEEVKNLIQIQDGKVPVPRVKLTVFNKTQRTSTMKKPCDSFVFNEHFYFDETNLTAEMLDSEKILIEVYDNNNTDRKDYFGIYEFDFGYIYNHPDHALRNVWIGLSNPESDDMSKIRGYLKLSVAVLHENDPRIELEPKDNELSNCIIPIQIQMKYKQISIFFFKGEEFPDMDAVFSEKKTGRRCDGYVEVKYMGVMRRTKTVEMQNEKCIWNQIIDIPATYPAVSQKICLVVKDEDVDADDIVGSYEFTVNDIFNGVYNSPKFIDIYGSPLNKHGGIYDQMNYNAEIGSRWKGRLLIKCEVTDVDSPIARVRDIEDKNLIETINGLSRPFTWNVWVRVLNAFYLPEKDKEYEIKISFQDIAEKTVRAPAINGCAEFDETKKLQLASFANTANNLPDIFIYLVDPKNSTDKQNICFQRISPQYCHLNNDILYIKLLPDPAIGKVNTMMKSGVLKCKINVFCTGVDSMPNEDDFEKGGKIYRLESMSDKLKKKTSKPIEIEGGDLEDILHEDEKKPTYTEEVETSQMKPYTIVAVVYMSKGLIAAESNGTSDPFVQLTLYENEKKTSVKNNTMNGVWNELLVFENINLDIKDTTTWPMFLLSVYDWNKIQSDVPLGYNYVWLCNTSYTYNTTDLINPKWHSLFLPKSNKKQGKILMSFYIFDSNIKQNNWQEFIHYKPETQLYNFEISVLGLRELKPLGLIGIKKPFIKFDLNSLNVTGDVEDYHAPIQTVPVSGGNNPTINTVITFETKLPVDQNFMPDLQCEVYDNVLKGLSNSLLGVFSIDIKKIIRKTKEQINEDINDAKKEYGLSMANQMLLNQFGAMYSNAPQNDNIINTSASNSGMAENSLENSQNNLISNSKEDNQNLLEISNKVNKGNVDSDEEDFLEVDENKAQDDNTGSIDISSTNINNMEIAIPTKGKKFTMQNTLKLGGDFLRQNLFDSHYFVTFPCLQLFQIPGYGQSLGENEVTAKSTGKIQKEFLMEDPNKIPDPKLYFKIGYYKKQEDVNPEDSTKHYRRIFGCPLEFVKQLKLKTPFNVGKIRRGKFVDKKSETSLFDAMSTVKSKIIYRIENKNPGEQKQDNESRSSIGSANSQLAAEKSSAEKSYGKFKGVIRVTEKSLLQEYEAQIAKNKEQMLATGQQENDKMKNYNKYQEFRKKLINTEEIIIRLYVLELNNLAKKDAFSESDPYIKIYVNDKLIYNERKNHQDDQKNCKWYKYYDITGNMPGSSNLKLEVWDYDDVLSDDLIGSTLIDLEDRYYNAEWQKLEHKPVEVRKLFHPDINGEQGLVYMWLEMFKSSEKSTVKPWKIEPEPITEFEVRFIVWETEDIKMMDVEGTSDVYVIGYVTQDDIQKTDVHYRCQTGAASFNWRMLLPLRLPVDKPELTMQVYDKDLFASDDFICGAVINLKDLVTIPKYLNLPVKFNRDYFNGLSPDKRKLYGDIEFLSNSDDPEGIKFWVPCFEGKKEATGEGERGGRVMCSLEIYPKTLADQDKVGKGREEPNLNPHLAKPFGRFEFTLNPFKLINQLVGPKFRRKCYCYCICCLLIAYFIFMLPTMMTNIVF